MNISNKDLEALQKRMKSGKLPALHVSEKTGYKRGAGMNETEQRYYDEQLYPRLLIGEYLWVEYESIRFRVGKGNSFYCPDFAVLNLKGFNGMPGLELHEVKGAFEREAARVRRKAAAKMYPFVFKFCQWIGGEFRISVI